MSTPKVLIVAGGTGGHIMPALAMAVHLEQKNLAWCRWLGVEGKMETEIIPQSGIPLHTVKVSGIRGRSLKNKLIAIIQMKLSFFRIWQLFSRIQPDIVISFGGYVSVPAGIVAWMRSVPLYLHEQNAIVGTANRILAPLAHSLLTTFANTVPPHRNMVHIGMPLRRQIVVAAQKKRNGKSKKTQFTLVVSGGSQGADIFNTLVPQALAVAGLESIKIIHLCGKGAYEFTKKQYLQVANIEVEVIEFTNTMETVWKQADIAIVRSGAASVCEMIAMAIPSLFVPFPHAIDDHQFLNASMAGSGAWICRQQLFTVAYICEWLQTHAKPNYPKAIELLNHKAAHLQEIATLDATKRFTNHVLNIDEGSNGST